MNLNYKNPNEKNGILLGSSGSDRKGRVARNTGFFLGLSWMIFCCWPARLFSPLQSCVYTNHTSDCDFVISINIYISTELCVPLCLVCFVDFSLFCNHSSSPFTQSFCVWNSVFNQSCLYIFVMAKPPLIANLCFLLYGSELSIYMYTRNFGSQSSLGYTLVRILQIYHATSSIRRKIAIAIAKTLKASENFIFDIGVTRVMRISYLKSVWRLCWEFHIWNCCILVLRIYHWNWRYPCPQNIRIQDGIFQLFPPTLCPLCSKHFFLITVLHKKRMLLLFIFYSFVIWINTCTC